MRREVQYLWDIIEAVDAIESFIAGQTSQSFSENDLVRSAVLSKLMIIGEAANHVSEATRLKYPAVPWMPIRGFRNIIIHAYHGINWEIVWNAALLNAPQLAAEVKQILAAEFPDYEPEND